MKIAGALGLVLLLFVTSTLVPIAVGLLGFHFLHVPVRYVVCFVTAGMPSAALLAMWFYVRTRRMTWAGFGFVGPPLTYFVWAILIGVLIGVVSQFGSDLMHDKDSGKIPGASALLIVLLADFLGPVGEEIVFRGLLQSVLTFRLRSTAASQRAAPIAIFTVSLLFMSLHWRLGLFTAASAFVASLVFGVLRHRSGSLLPSMLCHIALNVTCDLVG